MKLIGKYDTNTYIKIGNEETESVIKFRYLEVLLINNGRDIDEVNTRIGIKKKRTQ